ncbi:HAMP domain-containing sensor histidine kinase [Nodosilinea sp. E11]|uniref:sensor histidine kinase n=1 Tax=Nodosilinea sp. E11 TaxID=3037479 RepID=UPI002934E881|nr:HAMP domain-containing sensor histidine kinase [Nodosilinea sp. E11]WOD37440.1 HAMP domain-containing sensor histidine kinase [Nodosilinea sp. E11]
MLVSHSSDNQAKLSQTSEELRRNSKKIMELWEKRARDEVSASIHQDSLALQNSLPLYLDQLADELSNQSKKTSLQTEDVKLKNTQIGRNHGHERAGYVDYTMSQLILEYHILRQVIFQILEKETPLSPRARDIIIDSIEQAVNDAATQFSDTLRDIQEMFMVTLTHDLRGPVNVVKMGTQLILRRFELGDTHLDITVRMISAIERMDAMIQNLLDASRLRAGQGLKLEFEDCKLDQLLHEVIEDLSFTHGDRFVIVSESNVVSRCSRKQIRRVIENLAVNAIKYGDSDAPITLTLQKTSDHIQLAIHNRGNPIPPETQAILFQQFRRPPSAEEKTGWGLGLFLAKNIIEAHRGTIEIDSCEAQGTKFVIRLPK